MKKLSKKQEEVVDLMKQGWELGSYWINVSPSNMKIVYKLQKDGLGKGGESVKVNKKVMSSLWEKDIIDYKANKSTDYRDRYKLSKIGKSYKIKK